MKILFIGNSYTFFDDLPFMLTGLIAENGIEFQTDTVIKGGRKLYENLSGDEVAMYLQASLQNNKYDILILQEQSIYPITEYEKYNTSAKAISNMVGAKKTVIYSTWARKEGHAVLDELGLTPQEMTGTALYRAQENCKRIRGTLSFCRTML